MLTSWRVARFKSAYEETDLELAPLTLFAGANSSGKSTIIQSMLLTAQTLQSPVVTRPVVLNGHIVRLGTFTDIVSNADEGDDILIGFRLKSLGFAQLRARPPLARWLARFVHPRASVAPDAPILLECHFKFSVRGSPESREIVRLQPLLEETGLTVRVQAQEPVEEAILVRRSLTPFKERMKALGLPEEFHTRPEVSSLRYEVSTFKERQPRGEPGYIAGARQVGASFVHFLMNRISVVYDAVDAAGEQVAGALVAPAEWWPEVEEVQELINEGLQQILIDEFKALKKEAPASPELRHLLEELESKKSSENILQGYRRLPLWFRATLAQRLRDRMQEIRATTREGRPPGYDIQYTLLPPLLSSGVELVQDFFMSLVKYLGPLRDEPKPVYPLAEATDPRDVGLKGEHTAAVLDIHRSVPVTYIPSKAFSQKGGSPLPQPSTLLRAVVDWLNYMGVGSQIETLDLGKLGHGLKIATGDAPPFHDVTQVGVGVSQVLPILVLSLLAEAGSTLVFEQPELHLHPRVQTRLADFFVSMTRLGKQCVVETHSEYLINRLRYLAASSESKEISDAVIIYFVEKEKGQSSYRKIRINEFGVIPDWPKGFFDESEGLAAEILRAGIEKKRQTAKGSDA